MWLGPHGAGSAHLASQLDVTLPPYAVLQIQANNNNHLDIFVAATAHRLLERSPVPLLSLLMFRDTVLLSH